MKILSISALVLISAVSASAAFANNNTFMPTQNADAVVTSQSRSVAAGSYASAPSAAQDMIIGHHSNN